MIKKMIILTVSIAVIAIAAIGGLILTSNSSVGQASVSETSMETTVEDSNENETIATENSASTEEVSEEAVQTVVSSEHYLNRQSLFEALELNNESVVFVGDSIIQRNEWAESFNNINFVNRGIDYDTIGGVLSRIKTIAEDQPKQIFILVGINDIYQSASAQDQLIEQYQKLLDTIKSESADTVVSLISLLPVNNSAYNHPIDNNLVVQFNEKLKALAETNKLDYIDVFSKVVDADNNELNAQYTNDGIHLTGEAYKIMDETITPYIK